MEEFLNKFFYHKANDFIWLLRRGDAIANNIQRNNVHEKHLVDVFRKFIKLGDNVIDLGANLGFHTLEMSRLVGNKGSVLSVEPLKEIYYQLCGNLLLNDIKNVTALQKICTDKVAKFLMNPIEWDNPGNTRVSKKQSINSNDAVDSFMLDDLIDLNYSFIKMDVQGSETNVLKGGQKFVEKNRPIFAVEIEEHHLLEFESSSKDLLNSFINCDYVLYRIMNEYPCDHIAIPKEKDTVDFSFITSYPIIKIDYPVSMTTISWPLYNEAIKAI